MRIYLKNNPAKFHPDPIWNDGALGFLRGRPNKHKKKKKKKKMMMMSCDIDPRTTAWVGVKTPKYR